MENLKQSAVLYEVPQLQKCLISVSIEPKCGKDLVRNEERDLVVILDTSGSMDGLPIYSAKIGVVKLLNSCMKDASKAYLMTFNHEAHLYKLKKRGYKELIEKLNANGGTDFEPVFKQIRSVLKELRNNVTIVFFTDGCGTYTQSNIDCLRNEIKEMKNNVVIHTIGFSEDHDAKLLSQLTLIGSVMGTFQFIENSTDIEESIENIIQYMLKEKIFAGFISSNKLLGKIELVRNSDGDSFNGDLLLDSCKHDSCKLLIAKNKYDVVLEVRSVTPVAKLLKCINLEIVRLINFISSEKELNRKVVDGIRSECENFKQILADIKANLLKNETLAEQRKLKQTLFDIETLINEFHMNFLTSAVTNTLTNAKIASLNDLAYGIIGNRTLKLKLDKRAQDNVELFDNIDNIVEKKVRAINLESLNPKDFDGQCMISCIDYIEALKNSDCICLTLDIERPEAAIMDPTRVIIKSINSSIVSAETFLDAVKYSLTNAHDPKDCHGGFSLYNNAKLFSGQSRESITGALPLFINEAHWSVARQKMKPIMGYMCTLNVLGYTYEQVATIPFSVLAKAIEDLSESVTDFKKKVFKAVLDTCLAVYRETPSIRESLADTDGVVKFIRYPIERTIDCTPNLSVFLVKLLCGIKNGNLTLKQSQYELLNNYIIEEEHRRKQVFLFPVDREGTFDVDKFLYKYLGVIAEVDIDPKVKKAKLKAFEILKAAKVVIRSVGKKIGGAGEEELTAEQIKVLTDMSVNEINSLVSLIESLKSDQEPRLDNALANESIVKFDGVTHRSMGHLRTLLTSYKAKHMADLPTMDKTCIQGLRDYQKLAIMVQNLHGVRNSDRRYYVENGLYIDPIVDPAILLEREYHRIVNNEIHKQCNLVRSKCVNFFSDILRATTEFYFYSDSVALAVGEFFLSIPNFNTE